MRLTLKRPIQSLDPKVKWSVLEVREHLTVGDLLFARRQTKLEPLEQDCAILARLCGIDTREVEELDYQDLLVLQAHLGRLLAPEGADAPKD